MQLSLFEKERYKITKPIRLIELFAGIGSQAKALQNIGVNFEHYRVVEFDKYAIKSYNAVHGTSFETSDITEVHADDLCITDTDKYEYLLTYSFPCQDLSIAGKGKGMAKGSGTRSGLLWEVERILKECKELPQVLLMENVPQVHSKKNIGHFNEWIAFLERLGYSNYYEDLNAKNYGIPQNRKRCFMVSILGDYSYEFPEPFELKLRLKDMLDDAVDEKYYLSQKMIDGFTRHKERHLDKGTGFIWKPKTGEEVANCLRANVALAPTDNTLIVKDPKCVQVAQMYGTEKEPNPQAGRIYSDVGLSPTLDSCSGGNRMPKVINQFRIRKLTPLECWRLMGFDDDDFHKAELVNSNTQLYKQAGNSIVVNVLEEIFKKLL